VLSIIKYVFKRHLREDIKIQSTIYDFNDLLPLPNIPSAIKQSVISTVPSNSLVKSYDELYRILIKLELPLLVKSVLPSSAGLRSTAFVAPVPFAVSSKDFFNDLVLQFETSVKWPDELAALENVKTAFLIKIHEVLEKETAYKSFITKDQDSVPYNFDISTLNVLTPEGYGFRIRVLTERDEILYLRAIENTRKEKKSELESIYLKFNQKYLGSPVHTRTISTISHHFPFYSPTVRLFKKWLDDQLILPHLTEELVELIALKPFVDPAQFDSPSSVENGFLKILNFLASWNWKEDPLILDLSAREDDDEEQAEIVSKLSDKLTVQSYQQIKSNFDNIRKQDPQGLRTQFFVASRIDKSGILWSKGIPLPIAARLTALSKVATQLINKRGINQETIKMLFTPSLADFDFVIRFKNDPLTLSSGIIPKGSKTFKNLVNNAGSYPSDLESKFDPIAKLVKELNLKFKGVIIFSYKSNNIDENGQNVLCGLFVPNNLQKSKFKVQLGYNFKPIGKEEVIINKEAIFNEILNYAGDLVVGFESK
jgi:U3 small nucleolar RNA-associated protein 22